MENTLNTTIVPAQSLKPENALFKEEAVTEDVKIVEEIMKQLKIESYDENVIPFLIEFMSGLKQKILEEAKTYAEFSGSTQILNSHALTAIKILQKRLCINGNHTQNEKDVIQHTAVKTDGDGVLLPHPVHLMETSDPKFQVATKKL